ncbi:MAG: CxxC-x17-CxxC domain-containing protein [Candidatus Omnitrophota bacterium]
MKIFGKEKTSSKSNAKGTGPELSEIVVLMAKIVERLDALEKKTDLVISQTSARSFGGQERPRPVSQPSVPSQPFRKPGASGRSNELKPARGRSEKILYKAVCADCHKDCEIPFKPTGERPVYCKECFSKRKAGNPSKTDEGNRQEPLPEAPAPLHSSQRQVVVTKKGVGKVTVSEVVRPSVRDISQKEKNRTPEKKLKGS